MFFPLKEKTLVRLPRVWGRHKRLYTTVSYLESFIIISFNNNETFRIPLYPQKIKTNKFQRKKKLK